GGTNFHAVLEEYTGSYLPPADAVLDAWPAELLIWRGDTPEEILAPVERLLGQLEDGARPPLADLAFTVTTAAGPPAPGGSALGIVAGPLDELMTQLRAARSLLGTGVERQPLPQGLHYARRPLASPGAIAFLFPGQGSQYVNMGRDLAVAFPEVRQWLDRAD